MRQWKKSSVAVGAVAAMFFSTALLAPAEADTVVAAANPEVTGQEWTTPQDVKVGQVPARTVMIPFNTVEEAKAAPTLRLAEDSSPNVRLLNGTWKFNYVPRPADKPVLDGVTEIPADFQDIPVPASWQVANQYAGALGTDMPIYNNQDYPFQAAGNGIPNQGDFEAAQAPTEFNPVGTYMRELEVTADDLDGNRLILSFMGVEAGFYLYVNGAVVGYGEDSFSSSEFDVTDYLQEGTNVIAAQVYRWTTGSFLENQDGLNFGGIHRDVYLTIQPEVSIYDYNVETTFADGDYSSSELELTLDVANVSDALATRAARATLFDAAGNQYGGTLTGEVTVPPGGHADVVMTGDFADPELWSAELPNLYTLVFELLDESGTTIQTFGKRVGFREFAMANAGTNNGTSYMTINGQNVEFYGTNRGQSHPRGGRTVPYEDIVKDVQNFKRLNINAMRSSHYPVEPHMLDLADEYGIYLMDEINNESHNGRDGINNDPYMIDPGLTGRDFPGNDSRYTAALEQRARSVVMRDKSNASVIIYSLGNEAGTGPNYETMIDVIEELDGDALIHYQGDNGNPRVDMDGRFYPAYGTVNSNDQKPGVYSEYQHAMGNTGGLMELYTDVFEEEPRQQGGFLWEYNDHSVYTLKPGVDPSQGVTQDDLYLGMNGSWQQHSDDGNFLVDGFVYPDRTWKPMAYEVRAHYQDLKFLQTEEQIGTPEFTLRNLNRFKNANYYDIQWSLLEDGIAVQTGVLGDAAVDLPPATGAISNGSEKAVTVPFTLDGMTPGAEYRVRLDYVLKEDTPYAQAGYVQGSGEFPVAGHGADVPADLDGSPAATVDNGEDRVSISGTTAAGEEFTVEVDKTSGKLDIYRVGGRDLLSKAPTGSFFRAETDQNVGVSGRAWYGRNGFENRENDGGTGEVYHDWIRQGENLNDVVVQVLPSDEGVTSVRVSSVLDNDSTYATTYAIFDDGTVKVEATLTPSDEAPDQLGEYGMLMQLPGDYENLEWYGRGPGESYWDRKTADKVGRWESTVTDRFFPYARIQETGNTTDVRWLALTDDDGAGLLASMDYSEGYEGTPLEAVALHYTPEALSSFETDNFFPHEAERTDDVVLRLLTHQKGVGNLNWGAEPTYAVLTKRSTEFLTVNYVLQPLAAGEDPALKARSIYPDAVAPLLESVQVDGMPLEGFDPLNFDQNFEFPAFYPEGLAPVVTATGAGGLPVSVVQAESVPGTAEIHVGEPGAQLVYRINLSYAEPIGPVVAIPDLVAIPTLSGSGAITAGESGVGELLYAYSGYAGIYEDMIQSGSELQTTAGTYFERGFAGNAQQIIDLDISEQDPLTFSATSGIDAVKSGQSRATVDFQVWAHKDVAALTREYYAPMDPGSHGTGTIVEDGWVLLASSGVMTHTSADHVFEQVPLTYTGESGATVGYQALRLVMDADGNNGHDQGIWGNPVINRAVPENPQLQSVTMDGAPLPGFDEDTLEYNFELASGADLPEFAVAADSGLFTWVTQADSVPGAATFRVGAKTYTVDLTRAAAPTEQRTGLTGFVTVPAEIPAEGASLNGNLLHAYAADGAIVVDGDVSLRVSGEGESAEIRSYEESFSGKARQVLDLDSSGADALRFTADVGLDWGTHPDSATPSGDGAAVQFEVWGSADAAALDNGYYSGLDSAAGGDGFEAGWTRLAVSPVLSNHAYTGDVAVETDLHHFDLDLTHASDAGEPVSYEALRLVMVPIGGASDAVGVWGDPAVTFTGEEVAEPINMIRIESTVAAGQASISYLFETDPTAGQLRGVGVAYDDQGRMIGYVETLLNSTDGNQDGDLRIPLPEGVTPARVELLLIDAETLAPVAGSWVKDPADGEGDFTHEPLHEVLPADEPGFTATVDEETGAVTLAGSGFAPGSVIVVEQQLLDSDGLDHLAYVQVDGTGALEHTYPSGASDEEGIQIRIGGQGMDEILTFPADLPDPEPTDEPTEEPTDEPTSEPTDEPTDEPSDEPTGPTQKPSGNPTNGPTTNPGAPVDIYSTPGFHNVNGRWWHTSCEPYSQTIRCRTEIWASQVTLANGGFTQSNGWAFNNLTYLPYMTRAAWASNPLGHTGEWTATDGRRWRTECDTAVSGRNGCRTWAWASFVSAEQDAAGVWQYKVGQGWVVNNIVRFRA